MIITRPGRPPNFEAILAAFPGAYGRGVIFAYGDDIYNPDGGEIPNALLAHEVVHCERQRFEGPELWWVRYINEPEFRYREELAAHVAEYKAQLYNNRGGTFTDRNALAKLLQFTALRLIAPLYNYQPPRTLSAALRDLRWEIEQ